MAGVAAAAAVAFLGAFGALMVGPRLGFVDKPDVSSALKVHRRPAVPLGGVGVFLAVHTGMTVAGIYDAGLAMATGGLLLLGLFDDRFQLAPWPRLVAQVGLAIVLVVLADGGWSNAPLSLAIGVMLTVTTINAVNLFDGLDGLVGTTAFISALGLTLLAETRGLNGDFGWIIAAALIGFLVLNRHPARVFLGDNGAYVVGALLAYGIMRASPEPVDSRVIVAAVVLGMIAIDLAATVIRRHLAGRPLFAGDRSHIYDQLRDQGWGVGRVVLVMALVQLVFAAVALGIEQVRDGPLRLILVFALVALSLGSVAKAGLLRTQPDSTSA